MEPIFAIGRFGAPLVVGYLTDQHFDSRTQSQIVETTLSVSECRECGAAVLNTDRHQIWHKRGGADG